MRFGFILPVAVSKLPIVVGANGQSNFRRRKFNTIRSCSTKGTKCFHRRQFKPVISMKKNVVMGHHSYVVVSNHHNKFGDVSSNSVVQNSSDPRPKVNNKLFLSTSSKFTAPCNPSAVQANQKCRSEVNNK